MITDSNSLLGIEFRMTWKSDAAAHIDNYSAQRVNFWRDCFPQQIFQKLLNKAAQEQMDYSLKPGEIVPAFQSSREHTIEFSQFDRKMDPSRIIEPRAGRFYPKGILTGMANIFRTNVEPFRCVEPMDSSIRISFNHPLASFPIDLKATVLNIHAEPVDRGGTYYDWLEVASSGPGMQHRVDQTDKYFDQRRLSDPVYAVWGQRR